jgi:PKD repeat protein
MEEVNFTQNSNLFRFSETVKWKNNFFYLRIFMIVLLNLLTIMVDSPLQAQICKFSSSSKSGCSPLHVVIKNECIGVDSIELEYYNNYTRKGDSIVLDIINEYEYSSRNDIKIFCYDSSKTVIGSQKFVFFAHPQQPVLLLPDDTIPLGSTAVLFGTDASGDRINAYYGDGTYDSFESHVYADTGIYHIKIPNHYGCVDTEKLEVYVKCPSIRPNLSVFFSPTTVCINEPVLFDYQRVYNGYNIKSSINFIFNDTVSKPNLDFTRTFKKGGDYLVTMKVTDVCGQEYFYYDTVHVKEIREIPVCFYPNISSVCPGIPQLFNRQVFCDHSVAKTFWNMGDGTIVDSIPFRHAYAQEGIYPVTVTAFNFCGDSAKFSFPLNVKIDSLSCNGFLNIYNKKLCVGEDGAFSFSGNCNQNIYKYLWHFGDGTSSTSNSAKHSYLAPGVYPVELLLSTGCSKLTYHDTVVVGDELPHSGLKILTSTGNTVICAGLYFEFYVNQQNDFNVLSYKWDFGDGESGVNSSAFKSYHQSGTYPVSVTLTGKCGNTLTLYDTVNIAASDFFPDMSLIFDSVTCVGSRLPISITGITRPYISRYTLDYGDGSFNNSPSNIENHIYEKAGNYLVSAIVYNICQVSTLISKQLTVFDRLVCDDYKIIAQPKVKVDMPVFMSFTKDTSCKDSVQSVLWNFGDGKYSNHDKVVHAYKRKGIYYVSLTVLNNCGDSKIFYDTVLVVKNWHKQRFGKRWFKSGLPQDDILTHEEATTYIIYPVPAKDYCIIKKTNGEQLSGKVIIRIFNTSGNAVSIHKISNSSGTDIRLPLTSLPSGTYIIEINDNGEKETHSLIKE